MPPDKNREDELKRSELTFFGQITASVTHEMNNVIGIIEQVAGLLEDLAVGVEYGRAIDPEKLKGISARIITQTERGTDLIKRLNYFAHTVDEPVCDCEMDELLQNLVDLCQRFAILQKGSLEAELTPYLTVRTNPFVLEQVVFIALRLSISGLQKEGIVKLTCVKIDSGALITVYGPAVSESEPKEATLELIKTLAELYNMTINVELSEQSSLFKLSVPNYIDEAVS
ncbi:hypothetical protein KKA00_06055 [bacterium]|nr:hypothetical protein [bacterium]MBU1651762.1 hypothetical protein [bacterium]